MSCSCDGKGEGRKEEGRDVERRRASQAKPSQRPAAQPRGREGKGREGRERRSEGVVRIDKLIAKLTCLCCVCVHRRPLSGDTWKKPGFTLAAPVQRGLAWWRAPPADMAANSWLLCTASTSRLCLCLFQVTNHLTRLQLLFVYRLRLCLFC